MSCFPPQAGAGQAGGVGGEQASFLCRLWTLLPRDFRGWEERALLSLPWSEIAEKRRQEDKGNHSFFCKPRELRLSHVHRCGFCCGGRIPLVPSPVTHAPAGEGLLSPTPGWAPPPLPHSPGAGPPSSRALSIASRYVFNNLTSTLTRQVAAALPSSPI